VLRVSTVNARQLVSRAHPRIQSSPRRPAGVEDHRRLVRAFIAAARAGELGAPESLLATCTERSAA
jgi:RNA polymerase sigma-70 factor (ECF subfamily)